MDDKGFPKDFFDEIISKDELPNEMIYDIESQYNRNGSVHSKNLAIGMDEDLENTQDIVKIKVLGTGGAGCNAIQRLVDMNFSDNVKFIAVNLDVQSLRTIPAHKHIAVGKTRQGAGGLATVGENAAREAEPAFREVLDNTDMLILTAGMGGGTGTGVLPIIAEIAKSMNILTFAIVYTPFDFEGDKRLRAANEGLGRLQEHVDTLIVISNQKLMDKSPISLSVDEAFDYADNTLKSTVEVISHIVNDTGKINLDFQDLKTATQGKGSALIGIGTGSGDNKMNDAMRMAMNHPLVDVSYIEDAENVLMYVMGKKGSIMINEINAVGSSLREKMPKAGFKWGYGIDDTMEDEIKLLLIITGFSHNSKGNYKETVIETIERTKPVEIEDEEILDFTNIDNEDINEYSLTREQPAVYETARVSGNDYDRKPRNRVRIPPKITETIKDKVNKPTSLIFKNKFSHKKLD